eukprot:9827066-Alexandrium_andersonii.AAC.1
MSASLVGSEMCIRDRVRVTSRIFLRSLSGGATPPNPPKSASGAMAPVSYTHLTLPTICSV